MSIRREMLQVARVAPKALGDSAALVRDFLLSQVRQDGAFPDRSGRPDLYYTVFGLDGLLALQAEFPAAQVEAFLRQQGNGSHLDFVHQCCLARCWGALADARAGTMDPQRRAELVAAIGKHRSADGGFGQQPASAHATAYGCFLGIGALQDLQAALPEPAAIASALQKLATPDGAWANETGLPLGATNATAAVITVARQCAAPVPRSAESWLLARCHAQGGFQAAPGAPLPDLLSTATALHALSGLGSNLEPIRERCLDFVDSLWTNQGGFHGHWGDDALDVEYTYYGLLALGHLAL